MNKKQKEFLTYYLVVGTVMAILTQSDYTSLALNYWILGSVFGSVIGLIIIHDYRNPDTEESKKKEQATNKPKAQFPIDHIICWCVGIGAVIAFFVSLNFDFSPENNEPFYSFFGTVIGGIIGAFYPEADK